MVGVINDGPPSAGHEPAGDVILAENRRLERQVSGLTADFQWCAGRESQMVQALRLNPEPTNRTVAAQRLNSDEVHAELLEGGS